MFFKIPSNTAVEIFYQKIAERANPYCPSKAIYVYFPSYLQTQKVCEVMKELNEYLPSMKLDGYSFELCQEHVDK